MASNRHISLALICEGPTDIPIIEAVAAKVQKKTATSISINVTHPDFDATSGLYESWGWTQICKWCNDFSAPTQHNTGSSHNIAQRMGFDVSKLSAPKHNPSRWAMMSCCNDAVIIVMDTDIAEEISNHNKGPSSSSNTYLSFNPSLQSRRDYCKMSVESWLNIKENDDEKLIFVLPTYAIETWLLALHCNRTDPDVFPCSCKNYEEISEPADMLVRLGYKSHKDSIKKSKEEYEKHAKNFGHNMYRSVRRCPELCIFVRKLIALEDNR
ncbi:MAG: hypothetical protein U2P59_03490 [Synergistota bacterium]|nr:hypothetical protein [Synergistota bacterium]